MTKDLVQTMLSFLRTQSNPRLWPRTSDHTCAVEQALWDLKGKALGIPVYEFLGGKLRDQVRTYANGWSYRCNSADQDETVGDIKSDTQAAQAAVIMELAGPQCSLELRVDFEARSADDRDKSSIFVQNANSL
jgi:L-alanine-DL-glutamate epimerase-like enolase superfamily enzyme